MNIFTKLVTEILCFLFCQFRYRQEGVDLLCSLVTLQLLQRNVSHGDQLSREVPVGAGVDEVPLLGVDLSAAGLLSHLLLRHRPGKAVRTGWWEVAVGETLVRINLGSDGKDGCWE